MFWIAKKLIYAAIAFAVLLLVIELVTRHDYAACYRMAWEGFRSISHDREHRYLGKPDNDYVSRCRGDERAMAAREQPWTDWPGYWGTGDASSRSGEPRLPGELWHMQKDGFGIDGALIDLEYLRIELIQYNLFDNSGTFRDYENGRDGVAGRALRTWRELALPPEHPSYLHVEEPGGQLCWGDLIRHRELRGICNDIRNPLMGSAGMPFARNVRFQQSFPEDSPDPYVRARHGNRIGPLKPDPAEISRRLLAREGSGTECNGGHGPGDPTRAADCPYQPAPFFNVLAAFWIQFMTHDWFSHLDEARNDPRQWVSVGCDPENPAAQGGMTAEQARALGCGAKGLMEQSLYDPAPGDGAPRAPRITANHVTAWWDASQLYGYSDVSRKRVKRDPRDPARLLMVDGGGGGEWPGERQGYLPLLEYCDRAEPGCRPDPARPEWRGQAATAFPDNWSIGMSFYHNVFAREHNAFVDAFRDHARAHGAEDSGLRHPDRPKAPIRYAEVNGEELFEIARLVVAAEIAKIHTIEWTTQLLYDEPMYIGMNSNWDGVFKDFPLMRDATSRVVDFLSESEDEAHVTAWYAVFEAGPGIVGTGSRRDDWSLANPDHVNGGVNHFGSPFNFPEEFVTVYRLHPLIPDLIEFRTVRGDRNAIQRRVPVISTFRGQATEHMRQGRLPNWALSMGRQRLGALTLRNHPRFLQNLKMDRARLGNMPGLPAGEEPLLDVVALDIRRDRERGIPRYNEFRRQYGLKHITRYEDFIDYRVRDAAEAGDADAQRALAQQREAVGILAELYGQHVCDADTIISVTVLDENNRGVDDCLGHPDGTLVDNVEDIDTVVGMLAEYYRPHGFAISETQFQVFILNASRRLYSDRFFTSSFRPEFYSRFGLDWVIRNGPDVQWEQGEPNGHRQEVLPFKRVLLRVLPELKAELAEVVNAFDPWARDRGEYYSLEWTPRADAADDPSFRP